MAGRVSTDSCGIRGGYSKTFYTKCRLSVDRVSTDASIDYRSIIYRDVDRRLIDTRPRMLQLHMIPLLSMYNSRATFYNTITIT